MSSTLGRLRASGNHSAAVAYLGEENIAGVEDVSSVDEARMEELYRDEFAGLVRFGVAVTGDLDRGEEVAQQAFIQAWARLDTLDDPSKTGAYLRTTLLNVVRRQAQRRTTEQRLLRPVRVEPDHQPDHASRMVLVRALAKLPLRQRACVVLRYYDDHTEAQTAEILGVSVGTVKSQTHKALQKLRRLVEDQP